MKTEPIVVAEQKTDEWYAARKTGIGASEIAAAIGLSPYQTPLELYLRKRGDIPEFTGNDATRMGTLLEPIVISEFARITGEEIATVSPPMYRDVSRSWMIASPDAITVRGELVEAKTASWRMKSSWGDEHSDRIPDQYLCQTQYQMAVMGADIVHVPVLFDGFETRIYKVVRNDLMIGFLIEAGRELWERIKNGDPPEPNWEHESTPKLIREMHRDITGEVVTLSQLERDEWADYEAMNEQRKTIEAAQLMIKSRLLHRIGDAYAGDLGDGRMIRRKLIEKKGHIVAPSSYIDVRVAKK